MKKEFTTIFKQDKVEKQMLLDIMKDLGLSNKSEVIRYLIAKQHKLIVSVK